MSAQITVSIFEPISSVSHNERFTLTYPIVTLPKINKNKCNDFRFLTEFLTTDTK